MGFIRLGSAHTQLRELTRETKFPHPAPHFHTPDLRNSCSHTK